MQQDAGRSRVAVGDSVALPAIKSRREEAFKEAD
jgi:hypothetical protein